LQVGKSASEQAGKSSFVDVIVISPVKSAAEWDTPSFTYHLPETMPDCPAVGSLVIVPFGPRRLYGIVVAARDESAGGGTAIEALPMLLVSDMHIGEYVKDYARIEYVKNIAELRKDGEKWVGELHSRGICVVNRGPWKWSKPASRKYCSFIFEIEIDTLTPNRIEGFILGPPENAKLNCKKCKYNKKFVKQEFSWIPE